MSVLRSLAVIAMGFFSKAANSILTLFVNIFPAISAMYFLLKRDSKKELLELTSLSMN